MNNRMVAVCSGLGQQVISANMLRRGEVPSITVLELSQIYTGESRPILLDVREAEERAIAVLDDTLHIPLMELESRVSECLELLRDGRELVVYCRSGTRSAAAVRFLENYGLSKVSNLEGGILAWSQLIDPSITQY